MDPKPSLARVSISTAPMLIFALLGDLGCESSNALGGMDLVVDVDLLRDMDLVVDVDLLGDNSLSLFLNAMRTSVKAHLSLLFISLRILTLSLLDHLIKTKTSIGTHTH